MFACFEPEVTGGVAGEKKKMLTDNVTVLSITYKS